MSNSGNEFDKFLNQDKILCAGICKFKIQDLQLHCKITRIYHCIPVFSREQEICNTYYSFNKLNKSTLFKM